MGSELGRGGRYPSYGRYYRMGNSERGLEISRRSRRGTIDLHVKPLPATERQGEQLRTERNQKGSYEAT